MLGDACNEMQRLLLVCCQEAYHELEGKEMEVMAMMLNGEDMFVRCRDHEAQLLRRKLVQLKAALNDTKAKAERIKVTLYVIFLKNYLQLMNRRHSAVTKITIFVVEQFRNRSAEN